MGSNSTQSQVSGTNDCSWTTAADVCLRSRCRCKPLCWDWRPESFLSDGAEEEDAGGAETGGGRGTRGGTWRSIAAAMADAALKLMPRVLRRNRFENQGPPFTHQSTALCRLAVRALQLAIKTASIQPRFKYFPFSPVSSRVYCFPTSPEL